VLCVLCVGVGAGPSGVWGCCVLLLQGWPLVPGSGHGRRWGHSKSQVIAAIAVAAVASVRRAVRLVPSAATASA
jgi:hypothetical protein